METRNFKGVVGGGGGGVGISCGHTTDFYLGESDLPRANSSKISRVKFISGFVLPTR